MTSLTSAGSIRGVATLHPPIHTHLAHSIRRPARRRFSCNAAHTNGKDEVRKDGTGSSSRTGETDSISQPPQQVEPGLAPLPPQSIDEESPFIEPLLRNLVLGVSAGFLLELVHVLSETCAVAGGSLAALPAALHNTTAHLSPLWVADNLVAVVTWMLLYLVEAQTVSRILEQNENRRLAAKAIHRTPTLPKRLMPVSLNSAKRAVYSLVNGRSRLTPAAANAGATAQHSSGTDTSTSSLNTSFGEGRGSVAITGGMGLLERPLVSPDGKENGHHSRGQIMHKEKQVPIDPSVTSKLPGTKREQQINQRHGYLRNFWYAAALAQDLKPDQPKEVKMLGRTVVLLRDEFGVPRAMDNVCPHRGAPLGKGWIKYFPEANGGMAPCIVCPYHGWAFDSEGKLREVPSLSDKERLPKRQLVETYPVVEKGGFVWLFFGSKTLPPDERPPIPFIPELEDPSWQAVYGEIEFDAPWWSVFDNAIDMSHIHYVHSDSFGNQDKPEIRDMRVEQYSHHISGTFSIHNKPVNPLWNWTAVDSVPVSFAAYLPSTSAVTITLARGIQMITFVNTVPVDEHRSVNRFCLIRNFASWSQFDAIARRAMYKILNEDKVMVETCKPESMRAEISLEPDLPQVAFRRLHQEWVDLGYAVSPDATQGFAGLLNLEEKRGDQEA
ncbi:hypothetical protein DUNSADRAFT_275 [Dunaliella salina]|uniref:Rieske domain-containing protein n=1 Tax=Dunaliella salina TaxID=3046 RepID=A0ABQ7FZ86_DUNSA|nr:hypothetical protein DUNSADRAFT_275 [Dunaliella salina]|eukprot:KAF5827662.1 hypothetical protein DUNSADRAFT_275 [Dunaliella salina]